MNRIIVPNKREHLPRVWILEEMIRSYAMTMLKDGLFPEEVVDVLETTMQRLGIEIPLLQNQKEDSQ